MATEIEERRVEIAELRVGMFVCRLDRPWTETSFPLQGVAIDSDADIRRLGEFCKHVFIDVHRQVAYTADRLLTRSNLSESRFETSIAYADRNTIEEELPRARKALSNATDLVNQIFADIAAGRELSVELVERAVRPLVASVLRSADAFLFVEGLRRHDDYSYSHAISCSALAAAFGRHMGYAEETIISLAAGGLLMDTGKTQLPQELLRYPGSLSAEQVEQVRSHVGHGLAILEKSGITDQDVIDAVGTHHERYDGTGYPQWLMGNGIPIAGRMLGIIDAYHAMASERPYRPAISRHQSMRQIYAASGFLFQAELVEQFQVCLGVYPTGSLVELNTGEVAVVMAQNQVRRLRPRVLIISTPGKQAIDTFRTINLMDQPEALGNVEIVRSLAVGDYGIDNADLFLQA